MTAPKEPSAFYMQPFVGMPFVEVFDAPDGYDPRPHLVTMAQHSRQRAAQIRCRGTTSASAREKARQTRDADLLEGALADWSPERCSRTPSGVMRVSLAKRQPPAETFARFDRVYVRMMSGSEPGEVVSDDGSLGVMVRVYPRGGQPYESRRQRADVTRAEDPRTVHYGRHRLADV